MKSGVSGDAPTLREDGDCVVVLDQTLLPARTSFVALRSLDDAAHAIRVMQVRGAPLIGATAAYGVALGLAEDAGDARLDLVIETLAATRPTAVNLHWALARMQQVLQQSAPVARRGLAWREARAIAEEDQAANAAIGRHGLPLIAAIHAAFGNEKDNPSNPGPTAGFAEPAGCGGAEQCSAKPRLRPAEGGDYFSQAASAIVNVMTHCNAGRLATVDHGTALAPVYAAHAAGIALHVWVSETRPRNQGLLTAWELREAGVPHTLIADNAAGLLMMQGKVDLVIVGADRIAANGDAANKVGTYLKALAARANGVPFYVAAPLSTIDFACAKGADIPIEERAAAELGAGTTPVANPAFDVTPAALIDGIVSERGVAPPGDLMRWRP